MSECLTGLRLFPSLCSLATGVPVSPVTTVVAEQALLPAQTLVWRDLTRQALSAVTAPHSTTESRQTECPCPERRSSHGGPPVTPRQVGRHPHLRPVWRT